MLQDGLDFFKFILILFVYFFNLFSFLLLLLNFRCVTL